MTTSLSSEIKAQFPSLQQPVDGKNLIYLDSAASALKPKKVIDRLQKFYSFEASNVHRGNHFLSAQATTFYEQARQKVKSFLGAESDEEIVFTSGTTDSLNLIAQAWGRKNLKAGDIILLTEMEHHANIVPWQMIAAEVGAVVKFAPVTQDGEVVEEELLKHLKSGVRIASFTQCSNALGTINPVKEWTKWAHQYGALVSIDGAQSVCFMPIDVQEIGCDFFSFSGHKLFGPYGIGVLYARKEVLQEMPPYRGGGSMISEVSVEGVSFNDIPFRFEAGTPNISGAIGLAAAIDFVQEISMQKIFAHEMSLAKFARQKLENVNGVRIIGNPSSHTAIFSLQFSGAHANDFGDLLNQMGIAVRTGHHCTQPLMKKLKLTSTLRASFSIYNDESEVHLLCQGLNKAREILGC